jgi:cell pole-organizing protein PopZ
MSDPKAPGNDASMDDILASIRKIISDDEARVQAGGVPAAAQPTSSGAFDQDVLILTDPIDDDQSAPRPAPSLAEMNSTDAVISVLHRLNKAVQDDTPVSAPAPGPVVGGGSDKTIEDMVNEMLRPMLKDWIDQNLPTMVQAIVEREISRPTRR